MGNPGQSGLSLYLYAEENWDTWSRPLFTDVQGNYPVKENEVMMSAWLLKRLGIEPVIGSEIPLSVTWEDRDVAEEETFVLSGYYTDTSYIDTASRQKVLVSKEALKSHNGQAEFVGFSFTAGQFQKKPDEVRKELQVSGQQNFKVLGGQGFHLSLKDTGTALAVILFFMLDGFLIIYNINTISVTKDIQFYGLLKTIGTAPGQLKRLMYYRMGNILLTALPVGLVLGGIMTQWIVPLILGGILEGFSQARFRLVIPFTAAFFSGLMIFVSFFMTARKVMDVSAIGALTFAEGSSARKKGIPGKTSRGSDHTRLFQMGLKNVFRQPWKAWMVIGTFFLSSVTFLLCMTVLGGMSLDEFIDYNYPDFTALDFLLYVAALKGLKEKSARKKSKELLEEVGLGAEGRHRIKSFSGGMKRRLGIAQAMKNDPRILILDEPTTGLDPKERVRFRNLISSFAKDRIVILSTHIVSDVEYITEKILMMKAGQIIHFGSPGEITSEIDGLVWECSLPTGRAEHYAAKLNASNLRNEGRGHTVLRIISEKMPVADAVQVQPNLEDLYLYYFREQQAGQTCSHGYPATAARARRFAVCSEMSGIKGPGGGK